ncbi:MAG: GTPase [Candidatus Hodgkinia cicadicola]
MRLTIINVITVCKNLKSTIFSLASKLPCAIATIRLSGNNTLKIIAVTLGKLVNPSKACALKINTLGGKYESVVVWRPCPYSPTGEDYAEISVAGATTVAKNVVRTLAKLSAVQAKRGNFIKRALINNKTSINNVLSLAKTFKLNCNIKTAKSVIKSINVIIAKLAAQLSSGANFSLKDYEIKSLILKIKQLKNFGSAQVCIIGKTNVGKSSLFNALTKRKNSIVSGLQGTTRDAVCAQIKKFTIADTAGVNRIENEIDTAAVLSSFNVMANASVALVLCSFSEGGVFLRCKPLCLIIEVISKSDLVHKVPSGGARVYVSAYSLEGIPELRKHLYRGASEASRVNIISNVVLTQMQSELNRCVSTNNTAIQLRLLYKVKTAITNITHSPILDNLLNKFCIGK